MILPEILSTRRFYQAFMQCIGRHPLNLRIVSPFVGEIPAFGSIVNFARILLRDEDVSFQLVTRPPGSGDGCIITPTAEALINLGVDLRIRQTPLLHSKVYQFIFREGDRAAFIGSANFSRGGLESNDETMALLRNAADNTKVSAEIDRLSGRGTSPFHLWRLTSKARSA